MKDFLIRCNVGPKERVARFVGGIAAGAGAIFSQNKALKAGLGAIGLAGVTTAMTRYCPVNQLMGRDHCQEAFRSVRQLARRI